MPLPFGVLHRPDEQVVLSSAIPRYELYASQEVQRQDGVVDRDVV